MVEYVFPKLAKLSIDIEIILKKGEYAEHVLKVFEGHHTASVYQVSTLPFDTDVIILNHKSTLFIERKMDIISGAIIESQNISKNLESSFKNLLGI